LQGDGQQMAMGDLPARRQALQDEVTRLAWDLAKAVREARALHLPVEPGVQQAGQALTRWAILLREVIPPPP
jgi:hypothetical protein